MKLGLDLHRTIDADPKFFVSLAENVIDKLGGEVHILTGIQFSPEVEEELLGYGNGVKWWTNFFSITTHLIQNGETHTMKMKGDQAHYYFKPEVWNKVKADYCVDNNIDLHIDDSPDYVKYFMTPYMLYDKFPLKPRIRTEKKYKYSERILNN